MLADHFKVATIRVDLAPAYDRLVSDLKRAVGRLPEAIAQPSTAGSTDIKARCRWPTSNRVSRMAVLYFIANSLNYLVAGTGNRSRTDSSATSRNTATAGSTCCRSATC